MVDSLEKIPVVIFPDPKKGSLYIAGEIAHLIREKQLLGQHCVLGLATGSTPVGVYAELVRLHREEGLSFKHVITFNLDEYYPIERSSPGSYRQFMQRHLFDHVDIDHENVHIPDGELSRDDVRAACPQYEQAIAEAGGIDLQILGIGNNGHIGFNEPGSPIFSVTRLVNLDNSTRQANAREFHDGAAVPRLAITMGIGTILRARRVILMAWGAKAAIVARAVEGNMSEQVPASFLQQHADCHFVLDEAAAAGLARIRSPWLAGEVEWSPAMVRRAVVDLALKLNKPVLGLTANDYMESGLSSLLVEKGDVYDINLQVYYMLRDSITGWPGGKPGVQAPSHP